MKAPKVDHHNVLKRFAGLSKYTSTSLRCAVLNVKSFGEIVRTLVYNFKHRIKQSGNSTVHSKQEQFALHISTPREDGVRSVHICTRLDRHRACVFNSVYVHIMDQYVAILWFVYLLGFKGASTTEVILRL